jgi:hypothetical protein
MPEKNEIKKLQLYTKLVTQTTAHQRYSTKQIRNKYEIPLHKLSVFASPENYKFTDLSHKENIIVISPDQHPRKEEIIATIKEHLKDYKIIEISNMKYEEYLNLISKAKYTLTFGEGLDFYLIDTVFSGGIGLAVYNEDFFTADFKNLTGIFNTYDELNEEIVEIINTTQSNPSIYKSINTSIFKPLNKLYSRNDYLMNIKKFYTGEYTFK